mmetsp:Transcript_9653/g.13294  ORF Transcript_9653/g.13294 Transcript_9653/m.13294 type:complete len:91 (-) Transcript_9653:111-383(-)
MALEVQEEDVVDSNLEAVTIVWTENTETVTETQETQETAETVGVLKALKDGLVVMVEETLAIQEILEALPTTKALRLLGGKLSTFRFLCG